MNPPDDDDVELENFAAISRLVDQLRTDRRFDPDRPLARNFPLSLISQATQTRSPLNLQPWRFIIVRDPKNRRKLRACTFGDVRLTDAPVVLIALAYLHPDRSDLEEVLERMIDLEAIDPARAAKLRATAAREWARGDGATMRAIRASMLAVGTLMFAAESRGLATNWIDGFEVEPLREAFGIPDDHAICGLLALGYPADSAPFPGRHAPDRVAFDEHFGRPLEVGEPWE